MGSPLCRGLLPLRLCRPWESDPTQPDRPWTTGAHACPVAKGTPLCLVLCVWPWPPISESSEERRRRGPASTRSRQPWFSPAFVPSFLDPCPELGVTLSSVRPLSRAGRSRRPRLGLCGDVIAWMGRRLWPQLQGFSGTPGPRWAASVLGRPTLWAPVLQLPVPALCVAEGPRGVNAAPLRPEPHFLP